MKYSKGILSLLAIATTGSAVSAADNVAASNNNNQTTENDRRRLSPSDPMARILGQGNGQGNGKDNHGQAKKRFKLAAKMAGSDGKLLEVDVMEATNAITPATTMGSAKKPIGKSLDSIYVADNAGADDDIIAIIGVNPMTEDMHGIVMPGQGKGKPMKVAQKKGKEVSIELHFILRSALSWGSLCISFCLYRITHMTCPFSISYTSPSILGLCNGGRGVWTAPMELRYGQTPREGRHREYRASS